MAKKNNFKRALIMAILAIFVCMSMFVGTTFAWFTDSVTSSNNKIVAGTLMVDLELLDKETNEWKSIKNDSSPIFNYDNWEPGYTDVKVLKVENEGSLALKWKAMFTAKDTLGELADVIDVFVCPSEDAPLSYPTDLTAYYKVGTVRQFVNTIESTTYGSLEAGDSAYLGIALQMQQTATNYYQGKDLGAFDISIVATQKSSESDSFGNGYDEGATFPTLPITYKASSQIGATLGGALVDEVKIGESDAEMTAQVPSGVKVENGATSLVLEVQSNVKSNANLTLNDGQARRSYDVHINGVAEDNTVPMTVLIKGALPTGLKASSVELYHVEDGVTIKMEQVDVFTAHNQFIYDSATGDVTINVASFSEIAAVIALSDPWNGTVDTAWYNDTDEAFTLTTPEQLAGLGDLVSNGNTFAGKTINLGADIDLGGISSEHVFYPIGYKSETPNDVYAFSGTFDGNGYRIVDLYQNTWNIDGNYDNGYYNLSLGLFAYLENATVRNLTLENFIMEGEFAPAGCVAGLTNGGTFENITLYRCAPATYNTGVGGLIGWDEGEGATYVFNNIKVDSSNTIVALWGSWDVACGGIMGYLDETSTATMNNCVVGAKLDVYNDVCANYQYYQYRYSGMLIGTLGHNSTPASSQLICNNCTVYYGDWADYYYCEFEKNSSASYTEDFQFSRVEERDIVFDINGNIISCTHTHTENEDKLAEYLPFNQLYTGYGWGSSPVSEHAGVTVVNRYKYTVTYMVSTNVVDVVYVTDNTSAYTLTALSSDYSWIDASGSEITSIPAGNETNVVVYRNTKSEYTARFVDANGIVIYEENFKKGATSLSFTPTVPAVTGYKGVWENYTTKLQNATGDIVINPVYAVDEVGGFEIIGETVTTAQLFDSLENGGNLIMSQNMTGTISGGSASTMMNLGADGKEVSARLDLNSFDLTYTNSSNANKDWTLFQIGPKATFTVGAGMAGSGSLNFVFDALNKNATPCMFDLEVGGTLILERGITIEIHCANADDVAKVTVIKGVSNLTTEKYPGLNIITEGNVIRIVVTGNTTLVGDVE